MITAQLIAGAVLASGESKKSGPIGLAVILVLCVACYFLFKSMSKHLRRVREDFPAGDAGATIPPAGPAPATSLRKAPREPAADQPPAPSPGTPPDAPSDTPSDGAPAGS
ncbi:MAG: hypothetical protein JWO57_1707 [Pseudonocardiales bacterium]|nr:hypothetical protein [Pseudonocardiales bacterium]